MFFLGTIISPIPSAGMVVRPEAHK
jgi:hypothetical protein